jgi:hypothetical protein
MEGPPLLEALLFFHSLKCSVSRDQVREHQRLLARHDIIEKRKEWLEKCNNEQAKVTTTHPRLSSVAEP